MSHPSHYVKGMIYATWAGEKMKTSSVTEASGVRETAGNKAGLEGLLCKGGVAEWRHVMTHLVLRRLACWVLLLCGLASSARAQEVRMDVVVYGATPAGIAAAIGAAKSGYSVILVEPSDRLGGMVTSGLSWTDVRTLASISGTYQEFCMRVERYYIAERGVGAPNHEASFRGLHGEPMVNLKAFSQMLNEVPTVRFLRKYRLGEVEVGMPAARPMIRTAQFIGANGSVMVVRAKVFIDATYEGDLMARAGVSYTVGREGPEAYNESLAADVPKGGDRQVQGYNFRLMMTDNPDNRVMVQAPPGYKRDDFIGVLEHFASGKLKKVFSGDLDGIYRTHLPLLPNRKADVNDTPHAPVRLSMPDINGGYPDGVPVVRQRIWDQHYYYNIGLLYFLQNDSAVPKNIQGPAREWGLCKDEFVDSGYVPPLLYVREARRMIGQYVFTENDVAQGSNDVRAKFFADAIAVGDYSLNCHGTGRTGTRFDGKHTGEFYKGIPPFQVPYGVIVPKDVGNLLVPVAVSASHVGFSCLRMEPTWTALGQAAGHAAGLAILQDKPVQEISVPMLQDQLHKHKLATIYLTDVRPGSTLFRAAQWFGARGAFHGLVDPSVTTLVKPEPIFGQYTSEMPGHEVSPKTKIDEATLNRWIAIAQAEGVDIKKAGSIKGKLRGEVLEKLYAQKFPEPKKKK